MEVVVGRLSPIAFIAETSISYVLQLGTARNTCEVVLGRAIVASLNRSGSCKSLIFTSYPVKPGSTTVSLAAYTRKKH